MTQFQSLSYLSPSPQERFEAYVRAPSFPCVGARSAVNRQSVRFGTYETLGDGSASISRLAADLATFSAEFAAPTALPLSYIAMFDNDIASEEQFEHRMWCHLQQLHDHDRQRYAWDSSVSSDPDSANFSFSVAGRAFFVVGLSPVASRFARRAPMPCLVFNFHDQFEALRADGRYEGLQRITRARDTALQGTINPVLARYGEASEARQYSGRPSDSAWRCSFSAGNSRA